ncbi:hypothetical protein [Kitasatospora sp. NPDC057015]|uniref:hypothetical protein n=1 Tax=Kitasatospora sp. NPDC057015 TaxID=3346001 RepID=UPI00363463C5
MDEDLRARLREAAAAHRPDRARMLARVERGTSPGARPGRPRPRSAGPASWPRVLVATLATAGTLVAGGFAVASVVRGQAPRPGTVTGPTAPTRTPAPVPPTTSPPPSSPSSPTSVATPATPAPPSPTASSAAPSTPTTPAGGPPPGSPHTTDGPLWADGSVDPSSTGTRAQSNVTIKTRTPLTSLTVELRIPQTGGVQDAGTVQTLPAADFTVAVRREGDVLVYRWTLRAGRTVPVGQHLFAGRYDHAPGGRDAKDDTYRADAGTADTGASVWGDFAPTR